MTDATSTDHARWNEEMARRYDPDLFHQHPSPLVRFVRDRRVAAVHRLLRLAPHHSVVDVGCGAGNVLVELEAARKVGVDLSEFLLDKARQRLGDDAELVLASGDDLPYDDATFDRALCSEVLEHVPDPGTVLAEIRRVLKTGGIAVVSVPNESAINRIKGLLIKTRLFGLVTRRSAAGYTTPEKMEDEWHLHEFDEPMLHRVAEPHFKVRRVVGIPFDALPLGYAAQLVVR